jgi:hypothetical protein
MSYIHCIPIYRQVEGIGGGGIPRPSDTPPGPIAERGNGECRHQEFRVAARSYVETRPQPRQYRASEDGSGADSRTVQPASECRLGVVPTREVREVGDNE